MGTGWTNGEPKSAAAYGINNKPNELNSNTNVYVAKGTHV